MNTNEEVKQKEDEILNDIFKEKCQMDRFNALPEPDREYLKQTLILGYATAKQSAQSEVEELRKEMDEATFGYQSIMRDANEKIQQLQSELATTRQERDNYFDELHAKRQELASVRSELERESSIAIQLCGQQEIHVNTIKELQSENKLLRDVVEGSVKKFYEYGRYDAVPKSVDFVSFDLNPNGYWMKSSDMKQLIASLERGQE